MREALKNAVQSAILFECKLPHQESGIDKACISSQNDICFRNTAPQEIAKVIYNGIVEFAVNEYEINYDDLALEQRRAILSRIRYNPSATETQKLKYGFYGEVLLDLVLRVFLRTSVVAARGYFYSPTEKSEAKGFDAFHLMERGENIDLWFGEAVFDAPQHCMHSFSYAFEDDNTLVFKQYCLNTSGYTVYKFCCSGESIEGVVKTSVKAGGAIAFTLQGKLMELS